MALVVLLRGLNVGGHRTFRPSRLAERLQLNVLARDGRFVFGLYRRHMKVISYLGTLDRLFGAPVTTRNWNTIGAIAKVLDNGIGSARN